MEVWLGLEDCLPLGCEEASGVPRALRECLDQVGGISRKRRGWGGGRRGGPAAGPCYCVLRAGDLEEGCSDGSGLSEVIL